MQTYIIIIIIIIVRLIRQTQIQENEKYEAKWVTNKHSNINVYKKEKRKTKIK